MFFIITWLITCVIEIPIMMIGGFRRKTFILYSACINAITNISLNLTLFFIIGYHDVVKILMLEIVIWIVEYLLYAQIEGYSKRLLIVTVLANLTSYLASYLF